MTDIIRDLPNRVPFQPFTVRLNNGANYLVATPDHAAVGPSRMHVAVIWTDDNRQHTVSARDIASVEEAVAP